MLSQLRTGAIQMFVLSGGILATYVPVASINSVGFAFKNYDQVWTAMDGPLGAHVRAAITKVGLLAFDRMWDNGYRQVTSSTHPIGRPADLKGFKIRVPASPVLNSLFKALGAAPTVINVNEAYSALQTRLVEGEENPLALINLFKFYEVQKFVSYTNHIWDGYFTLVNAKAWAEIPDDLQAVIMRHVNEAAMKEREDIRTLNDTMEGDLVLKGMAFNKTDPDEFRAALKAAGFYAEWKQKYGAEAWAVLEDQVGALS
jgi:tripartite ATP-independent transporter DctP family solute receptor